MIQARLSANFLQLTCKVCKEKLCLPLDELDLLLMALFEHLCIGIPKVIKFMFLLELYVVCAEFSVTPRRIMTPPTHPQKMDWYI